MKIYFCGSIRGGRDDAAIYARLIDYLRHFGEVLTEHVGDPDLTETGDDGPDDRFIHDRDMTWLKSCDMVVAEVTMPSLGVGYELGWAAALAKPVLCLHRSGSPRPVSAMIAGSPALQTVAYAALNQARRHVDAFIDRTAENRISQFDRHTDKAEK